MTEIIYWVIDKIITAIPGTLLRLIYPPEKVASQIKVRLKGETPINPSLNSSVPHLDIYFEVTNLSNIDLEIDRLLIDLWFGQPVLIGAILDRKLIKSRSDDFELYFREFLSSKQIKQIEPYLDENPPSGRISLDIRAYFNSKIGQIKVKDRFERNGI